MLNLVSRFRETVLKFRSWISEQRLFRVWAELGVKSVSVQGTHTSQLYLQTKCVLVVVPLLWMNTKPLLTLEPVSGIPGVTVGHLLTRCHHR